MPRTGDWRGGAGPTSKTGRLREVSSSSVGGDMLGKPIFDSNALDEDILDEDPFVTSRSSLSYQDVADRRLHHCVPRGGVEEDARSRWTRRR